MILLLDRRFFIEGRMEVDKKDLLALFSNRARDMPPFSPFLIISFDSRLYKEERCLSNVRHSAVIGCVEALFTTGCTGFFKGLFHRNFP
ncbi:hypothetical protein TNCV_4537151 [Trichonephila clavipes]|nr:hypothetical protein TNCV_4537151 [Trichonephila clavipes]